MEFFEVIEKRHSIRSFQKKAVPKEKVGQVLKALNSAPSAGDLQAFEVVVVEAEEKKAALAQAALGQNFIAEAASVLVFFADPERSSRKYGERGAKLYCLQDATIAAAYAQLACRALGLGCCWVGAFDEAQVIKAVNAPKELVPIALLPLGFPAEKPFATERRSLKELVQEESF